MTWHTGRTVGVTLYQGDGPSDMVGVMVGSHDAACDLARRVVAAVNAHDDLVFACETAFQALQGRPGCALETQVVRDVLARVREAI
jgi:hypothetical protein